MKLLTILIFFCSSVIAQAQVTIDPERRAIFADIIADNGCKMNNFSPSQDVLDAFAENEFSKEELRAYGSDFLATGDGVAEGRNFVLKIGKCG